MKFENDEGTEEETEQPKEKPRKFCIHPEFTYETQIYNPN
jgi:hypothetical protein